MSWFFFSLLFGGVALLQSAGAEPEPIATVTIFIATDCPIANSYAPEINKIYGDYSGRGIKFQLVYPDPELREEALIKHIAEYRLKPPTIVDRDHTLVKRAGVTTTPEVAVFDASEKVIYRGRIDNRYADYGERRRQVTERYLRDALDAVLKGEKPALLETEAVGCLIERMP